MEESDSDPDVYLEIQRESTADRLEEMVRMYGISNGRDYNTFPGFWSDPFGKQDFCRSTLRKIFPRLLVSVLIFHVGLYMNNVSQAWLQQKMVGYYETRWPPNRTLVNNTIQLWDVSFYALPYLSETAPADTFAGAIPLVVIIRFLILPGPLSLRWTIFNRVAIIWGLLWLGRACTILSTPLPNPDYTCKPRVAFPDNIWLEAWANLPIVFYYNERTCQDVLYSGHTVAVTLNMLVLFKYVPLSPWTSISPSNKWCSVMTLVQLLGLTILIFGYYTIVASHFHYTIDVLLGVLMTYLVFQSYHWVIRMAMIRRSHRCSLYPFIKWMERDAKDLRLWRAKARRIMKVADSRCATHRPSGDSFDDSSAGSSDDALDRSNPL